MGSWQTPFQASSYSGVVPRPPGPKFVLLKPLGPVVGKSGPIASVSVREMIQQVCLRRLEFKDVVGKRMVSPDSIEKAKTKAQSRFVQHLCASESAPSALGSEAEVAQDVVRGLHYLQGRQWGEEGFASQELVRGLHAELCCSSAKGAGQLRTCYAYSRKGNDIHWFPPPHVIPSSFAATFKKHNYYISKKTTFADQHTPEYVDFVCRCAASLLYDFVDLHPFKDGNGLVAHLLASSVLRLVAPFPVIVSFDLSTLYEQRDAVCWERDNDKLSSLAAALLEGLWCDWEWFAAQHNLDK